MFYPVILAEAVILQDTLGEEGHGDCHTGCSRHGGSVDGTTSGSIAVRFVALASRRISTFHTRVGGSRSATTSISVNVRAALGFNLVACISVTCRHRIAFEFVIAVAR
jgi:hypothetical protein